MEIRAWTLPERTVGAHPERPRGGCLAVRRPAADRCDRPVACCSTRSLSCSTSQPRRLGVAQTAEVLDLIERVRDRGLGVIMISHNMEDVRAVADRIVVLRLGRNNGVFYPDASNQELVSAITGAADNAVSRRSGRRQVKPRPRRQERAGVSSNIGKGPQATPLLDRSDVQGSGTMPASRGAIRVTA